MTNDDDHLFEPARRVLRGHVSETTAYLVDDYPYGPRLRCEIRYWLHVAESGAKAGQVRRMRQTTNPRAEGNPWNKPRGSTYATWAVLYEDSHGYVMWWRVNAQGPTPWTHMRFCLVGLYDLLDQDERSGYERLLNRSRQQSAFEWQRARQAFDLIGDGANQGDLLAEHSLHLHELDYRIAARCIEAGMQWSPPESE